MEDYEKKYKDAFKRAKELNDKLIKNGTLATSKGIESIFPELRESDDGRMRKNLREFLLDAPSQDIVSHHLDLEETLAWLEKQGEQKERGFLSKDEEYTLARIIEYLEDNDCPSKWKDLLYDVYGLPYQKEQKSAWNEEDYDEIGVIACHLDNIGNEAMANSLLCIKDKYNNIKPKQEWSKEDEKMFRSSRCYLNEFGNWLSSKNEEKSLSVYKACDWLKSIKERMKGE